MAGSSVVADTEGRLRPLATEANLAVWQANVDAGPETEARRVASKTLH